jgi:uncharacterized LabA/DUF88 family protein
MRTLLIIVIPFIVLAKEAASAQQFFTPPTSSYPSQSYRYFTPPAPAQRRARSETAVAVKIPEPESTTISEEYAKGSIVIVNHERALYFVEESGRAVRYPVAIGSPVDQWDGVQTITAKRENPKWYPSEEFSKYGELVRSYFYTVMRDDDELSSIRPLVDWLDYNGYAVRTKPAKEHDDGEGGRRVKRELAVDALEIARRIDHAFLLSGDGDLRAVTEAVQRLGVRVTVVSSVLTKPPMIADELRRQADVFLEVDTLRATIERPPHPIAPE